MTELGILRAAQRKAEKVGALSRAIERIEAKIEDGERLVRYWGKRLDDDNWQKNREHLVKHKGRLLGLRAALEIVIGERGQ